MTFLPQISWFTLASADTLIVQVSLLIALVWFATSLLRRSSPGLRHALWLLVLIRLALPVELGSPIGVAGETAQVSRSSISSSEWALVPPHPEEQAPIVDGEDSTASSVAYEAGRPDTSLAPGQAWLRFLTFIWMCGSALFIVGISTRYIFVLRKLGNLKAPARPLVEQLKIKLMGELDLDIPVRLVVDDTSSLPAPAVIGLFRPTVVLTPEMAEEWPMTLLSPVLLHELVHVRRRDAIANVLQLALQVVWFFHPLVWLANKALRRERELLCDDEVIQRSGGDATTYAQAIVAVADSARCATGLAAIGLAMAEARSTLGQRIQRMLHPSYKSGKMPRWQTVAAALMIGAACLLLSAHRPLYAEDGPESRDKGTVTTIIHYLRGFRGEEKAPVEIQGDYRTGGIIQGSGMTYPPDLLAEGISGLVVVGASVDQSGRVGEVWLVRGLDPRVDDSCLQGARKMEFSPTVHKDGDPVALEIEVRFNFRSSEESFAELFEPNEQWQDPFRAAYGLAADEHLKVVGPPWIPERTDFYAFPGSRPAEEPLREADRLTLYWEDDEEMPDDSSSLIAYGHPRLTGALSSLGIQRWAIEGPTELLEAEFIGDIVLRKHSSVEDNVRAFEPFLRRRFGDEIRLRVEQRNRPTIVMRGQLELMPLEDPDIPDALHVYHLNRDTGRGMAGGGDTTLAGFADSLSLALGRPVACDIDEAHTSKVRYRIHRDAMGTEFFEEVLANLEAQTSLRFSLEDRPTLFVIVEAL